MNFVFLYRTATVKTDVVAPGVSVVDRNVRVDLEAIQLVRGSAGGDTTVNGQYKGGQANIVLFIGGISRGDQADAEVRFFCFIDGRSVGFVKRLISCVIDRSMQKRQMRGIAFAFEPLKVVAFEQTLGDVGLIQRNLCPFVVGKERLVAWAEVSIDHAAGFVGRIGRVTKFFSKITVARLRRGIEHITLDVVLPAVIDAAQPAFFIAPVKKRRATVRAVLADQADPSLSVAKGDQLFTQQAHPRGRAVRRGDFLG